MKVFTSVIVASALSVGSAAAINGAAFEGPVLEKRQNAWQINGCYSSAGDLTKKGTDIYQSSGNCETVAQQNNNAKVIALINGDTCYYGNDLPPASDKVDMSQCNTPCHGYNKESCGGSNAYLIWTNGQVSQSSGGSTSDSSSSQDQSQSQSQTQTQTQPTTTAAPIPQPVVVTTNGGTTIVVTGTPDSAAQATVSVTSAPSPDSNSSSSNKAPIAAGVVVGVVGLAGIVGGAFLFLRSRKQRQEAAELQRQSSSAGFASRGEKPPSTYSNSDSRLEPAFMRRMSDGSIADNQDYSRRILKVTNPDDR